MFYCSEYDVVIKSMKIISCIVLGLTLIFLVLKWFSISAHYIYFIRWQKVNQIQNHIDCPETYILTKKQSGLRNQDWFVKYPYFYSFKMQLTVKPPKLNEMCVYESVGQL